MPDNQITRLKLEFTIASGPEVTAFFALDPDTLRAAQNWLVTPENQEPEKFFQWLLHNGGKLDRDDGPALIRVLSDGTYIETWYCADLPHRDNGPAREVTRPDGTVIREWWTNGDLTASIEERIDDTIIRRWWKNGALLKSATAIDVMKVPGVTILPPQP